MSDPFLGEVRILPYNFAPQGWASCDGQLIPIAQNQALYAVIGPTYGGDGRVSMGLPRLSGGTPLGVGTGPGIEPIYWGEYGGQDTVTLMASQLPEHNHRVSGEGVQGTQDEPAPGMLFGGESEPFKTYKEDPTEFTTMSSYCLSYEGKSVPHENKQPFLTVQYCICLDGVFPSRN